MPNVVRARGEDRRGKIPDVVGIHAGRLRSGAWVPGYREGDPIKGAYNGSEVGTLAARTAQFRCMARMDKARAELAMKGFGHVRRASR